MWSRWFIFPWRCLGNQLRQKRSISDTQRPPPAGLVSGCPGHFGGVGGAMYLPPCLHAGNTCVIHSTVREFLHLQPSVCKPGCRAPRVCEIRGNPQTKNCVGEGWRHRVVTIDCEQAAHATRRGKGKFSQCQPVASCICCQGWW